MKFKKVYVEITNICNKDCYFCSKSRRKKEEINLENFELIIKQIKPYTDYLFFHIKGEPLLHSNFKEIVELCDKYEMKVNITTNGTYLSKQKEIIANSKSIRQINVSIHAVESKEEINDILSAAEYIKNKKDVYIVYRYWLLKDDLILEDNIVLNELMNYYSFSVQKRKEIKTKGNIKISNNIYINKDVEFDWPTLENSINNNFGFCYGLKTHIGILSDGTVVPCCLDSEGIINLGNIYRKQLSDILLDSRTQNMIAAFKDNKRVEELCKHCSFRKKA
jgi:radical SAM protein with 4Fe4S-binding SPASM domain